MGAVGPLIKSFVIQCRYARNQVRAAINSTLRAANCLGNLIALTIFAFLFPVSAYGQESLPPTFWFERSLVGMEVGPTGAQFGYSDPNDKRYCAKWDGAKIVEHCIKANAEYLVLWLRDGDYAYYNSKLLPKAPGLGQRDPCVRPWMKRRR